MKVFRYPSLWHWINKKKRNTTSAFTTISQHWQQKETNEITMKWLQLVFPTTRSLAPLRKPFAYNFPRMNLILLSLLPGNKCIIEFFYYQMYLLFSFSFSMLATSSVIPKSIDPHARTLHNNIKFKIWIMIAIFCYFRTRNISFDA